MCRRKSDNVSSSATMVCRRSDHRKPQNMNRKQKSIFASSATTGKPPKWGSQVRASRQIQRRHSTNLRSHPNKVLIIQFLFAVPAVGAQEPALRHAVIKTGHIFGQDFRSLCRKPVMADKHRLGGELFPFFLFIDSPKNPDDGTF